MTHGYSAYSKGCRCGTCTAAKRAYMRRQRAFASRRRELVEAGGGRNFVDRITHGISGYQDRQCRCEVCCAAKMAASARETRAPDGRIAVEWRGRPATRSEREGMGRRQCTSEYKLAPINLKVRELLGATPPDFRRVPRGRVAEQWIGFSTDEIDRVSDARVRYLRNRHPLLELGMDRDACKRWLAARGWTKVEKSACIGCPYHGNRQWRELRDQHPDEWADAVAFDEAIRKGGARGLPLNGEAFLHRSRVPLRLAPIDRTTLAERKSWQGDLLAELGDPDGCSPYGCRSGAPVGAEHPGGQP